MAITTRKVVPSRSVVCADLNDEAVSLNVETGIYFGLDSVGAHIWKLLDEGVDKDEIVHRLVAEYDVSETRLHLDVTDFLAQLAEHGLLEATQA